MKAQPLKRYKLIDYIFKYVGKIYTLHLQQCLVIGLQSVSSIIQQYVKAHKFNLGYSTLQKVQIS
jgi:hypothetical protein